jgi:hypothetical protein
MVAIVTGGKNLTVIQNVTCSKCICKDQIAFLEFYLYYMSRYHEEAHGALGRFKKCVEVRELSACEMCRELP